MSERLRRVVRVVLILLAVPQLVTGAWAVLAPTHWFNEYPGGGRRWVVGDGPFNHHLTIDAGSGFLAVFAALALAALWPERRVVIIVLVAFLFHTAPHFIYHALHPHPALGTVDEILSTWGLALEATVALALLVIVARSPRAAVAP